MPQVAFYACFNKAAMPLHGNRPRLDLIFARACRLSSTTTTGHEGVPEKGPLDGLRVLDLSRVLAVSPFTCCGVGR